MRKFAYNPLVPMVWLPLIHLLSARKLRHHFLCVLARLGAFNEYVLGLKRARQLDDGSDGTTHQRWNLYAYIRRSGGEGGDSACQCGFGKARKFE